MTYIEYGDDFVGGLDISITAYISITIIGATLLSLVWIACSMTNEWSISNRKGMHFLLRTKNNIPQGEIKSYEKKHRSDIYDSDDFEETSQATFPLPHYTYGRKANVDSASSTPYRRSLKKQLSSVHVNNCAD